ncbi:hypothetical protein SLEP1_g2329 [Rubroshorea leprosula]|uniref:DUF4219 domain-containing protein n=1 Tax=Rubroshorea leprosula TaxID=152421 RepID=A0AAV5HS58_9ROSI|nr:hypothetical protein SLEP1_g2329 [Rubroshorea leprosula]
MAQFQSSQPLEGLSTTKPPFFDGTNYNYWKNRMKVFMLANVPKAWFVTMKGPYVPMKVVGESEVPKEKVEWNDEDLVKIMINNKAINMLSIQQNSIEYPDVIRPRRCGTCWRESKDLDTLKLEGLIEKLMTYEIEVQVDGGVEVVEKKKKNVAFKVSNQKKESEDDASNDESSNEEDITKLISKEKGERKNKKSMKKKAFTATWSNDETSSTESESSLENGVANLCFMAQKDSYNDEELQEGLEVKGNKWVVLAPVVKLKKKFSPRDICIVLAIPEGGDDEFQDVNHALVRVRIAPNCTENQIKVGSFSPENRALQWIISRIIAQRKRSKSFVLASDLPWFDYFLNGKRVNLGRFIFRSLIKNYSLDMGLSHCALITRLVKRKNIDLDPFKHGRIKVGTILTKAFFEKMQVVFQNGSWMKKGDQAMEQQADEEEGDTYQEMAEQTEEEHEDDSLRPFRVSMQRTNRKTMELMISEIQQLHTDFYGFRTEMRGRMNNVEGKLDRLVNHFFPPPPPDAT